VREREVLGESESVEVEDDEEGCFEEGKESE